MAQNNYVENFTKKHGKQLNHAIITHKQTQRIPKKQALLAKTLHGFKAKLLNKKKRILKKQSINKIKVTPLNEEHALPVLLMDRETLTSTTKGTQTTKATKYAVPVPAVRGVSEAETFKIMKTGKRRNRSWKRMVVKPCYVGEGYTRRPPKFERFVRPMGLRMNRAHVTVENGSTHNLPILGIKKNPHSEICTSLGVLSKGTVIEVNVSELGMVSGNGKVVWGKYAQVTNHPENDGCVNAVLLV